MTNYEAGLVTYNQLTVAERIAAAVPVNRQNEIMRLMANGVITLAQARILVMRLRDRFIERLGKAYNERTGATSDSSSDSEATPPAGSDRVAVHGEDRPGE